MTLTVEALGPDVVVALEGAAPPLDPDLEREVARLWQLEQEGRSRPLFNGELFSLTRRAGHRLAGRFVEYRRFIAQLRAPELFAALGVRPLGVSGLLSCPDGIVFGRRASGMTLDPGFWELVPSGNLDREGLRPDGTIDLRAKIAAELTEEIGCPAAAIASATPFVLVEDERHVYDIGVALETGLSAAALRRAHAGTGCAEYDALEIVPAEAVAAFVAEHAPRLVRVSQALLEWRGILRPRDE